MTRALPAAPRRAGPEPDAEPLDLRLAIGAAAGWLAVLLAADHSGAAVLGCAIAATVVAVGLLSVGRSRVRASAALALALLCVALVLLPLAGRIHHAQTSPLTALARNHASVTLEGVVTADPRTLAAGGPAGAPRVGVELAGEVLVLGERRVAVDEAVFVLGPAAGWGDVLPGQRERLEGGLQPDLDGSPLSVTLFADTSPQRLGVPPWWQRAAGTIRSALRASAAGLPADVRGLLPGLVDGDTTELDPVLAQHFRLAGLTHLVAVSGTNCTLVVGAVLLLLRRLRARPWVCAFVGGLVLAMFVLVARPSPSVLRAALMSVVALGSLATGRPRAAMPALSAVVLGLLIWDPTLAGSASFAMSVLATAALLTIAPGWAAALRRRRVPVGLAESVAVAAAATS